MAIRMANCGHDENNQYHGGKAGDQTGTEWYIRNWYSYPWNYILRWKDASLGELFATLATKAANNNNIGYDQWERDTFWTQLKKVAYDPSKITVPCETDCSAGTVALIKAVGYLKGIADLQQCSATYTGNMMDFFRSAAGQRHFQILTGKYLTDSSYARKGDINLNTAHHVNITIDNGSNSGASSSITTNRNYLMEGDKGDAVKAMQKMLITCGFNCGTSGADGDFGPKTTSALKLFQHSVAIKEDGKYGPTSKAKLEAKYKSVTEAANKKSIETVAKEVLAGKWGNDPERSKKLKAAGYDTAAVQAKVNELYKASKTGDITAVAKKVMEGAYGNDPERSAKLKAEGYDPKEVQAKVNELYKK